MSHFTRRHFLGFRAYTLHARKARSAGMLAESHLALVCALEEYRIYRASLNLHGASAIA